MQGTDTVPNQDSVPMPSILGGLVAYPRPEAEKPQTVDTEVNKSLSADTRPGAIARSDDAPYIYAEINKLCIQFGRLEKEVELSRADALRHAITLNDVHIEARSLCSKHEQTKADITALSPALTQSIGNLITAAEDRLTNQITNITTNLTNVGADVKKTTIDVAQLQIDQATALATIKVVTPVFKKTAWIFGSVISGLVIAAGLFWSQSMRPNLVKEISAEAHKTVLEVQRVKEVEAENARLKAENEALKRKK